MNINFRPLMKRIWIGALGAVAVLMAAGPASADLLYTLNLQACSGTCAPGPFGTIDLHQVNSTTVTVTETLLNGAEFVHTGAGDALAFNILGNPAIAVSGLTTGFAVDPNPPVSASAFGNFDYGIICTVPTGCGNGGSNPNPGPLTFSTTDGSALSINNFIANVGGYFFASDIIAANGATGNVASNGPPVCTGSGCTPVPEPASLTIIGSALLGLAAVARRRRKDV